LWAWAISRFEGTVVAIVSASPIPGDAFLAQRVC
jgi:hypothetical protein